MASSIRRFILILIITSLLKKGWCNLLSKPTDVVVMSGDVIILNCSSNSSKGVLWTFIKPLLDEPEYISSLGKIVPPFSTYISLANEENGRFDLKVNASRRAAGRYDCTDKGTPDKSSAELVVLESEPKCKVTMGDDFVNTTCIVKFSGNWNPVLEWKQWNGSEMVDVGASELSLNPDHESSSTISLPRNHSLEEKSMAYQSQCTIIFQKPEILRRRTAENVPEYNYTWISPFIVYGHNKETLFFKELSPGKETDSKSGLITGLILSCILNLILIIVIVVVFYKRHPKPTQQNESLLQRNSAMQEMQNVQAPP